MCMSVCVCVCVRESECVCVCVCVCILNTCLLRYSSYHIISLAPLRLYTGSDKRSVELGGLASKTTIYRVGLFLRQFFHTNP